MKTIKQILEKKKVELELLLKQKTSLIKTINKNHVKMNDIDRKIPKLIGTIETLEEEDA